MQNIKYRIIYQDHNLFIIDKPAGITVFPETKTQTESLIDLLLTKFPGLKDAGQPPRYGAVHRLDKDTSGILLVAKNKISLKFLQQQFKNRQAQKQYLALVIGNIKEQRGIIETFLGRAPADRKKQKVYLAAMPEAKKGNLREAITEYRVLKRFFDGRHYYALLRVSPKTGRKHQIRAHLAYLQHPVAGDKIYGFKNQPDPKNLKRQFLHAHSLKIRLPDGGIKEFISPLPEDLNSVLQELTEIE